MRCVKSLTSALSQQCSTVTRHSTGHFDTSAELSRPKDQSAGPMVGSVSPLGPNCTGAEVSGHFGTSATGAEVSRVRTDLGPMCP